MPRLSTYLGHTDPKHTYWYLSAAPELLALAGQRLDAHLAGRLMSTLAPTLQAFFTDRLAGSARPAPTPSPPTGTRSSCCWPSPPQQTGKPPSQLDIADLDAALIGAFLEPPRNRPRQQRPHPQRPPGRHPLPVPLRRAAPPRGRRGHRTGAGDPTQTLRPAPWSPTSPRTRSTALLAAPDHGTWTGRRDHALLMLACQTGLRATELHRPDPRRCAPGHRGARQLRRARAASSGSPRSPPPPSRSCAPGCAERAGLPADPLFPTRRGTPLSRDALERRLARHAATAALSCPTLREKKVSPARPAPLRGDAAAHMPASTPPSSRCGWGTRTSPPHRSTSTPTSRSRNGRLPEPHRKTRRTRPLPAHRHVLAFLDGL